MESNARVKSNLGIAHAAVANMMVARAECQNQDFVVFVACICLAVARWRGSLVAAKWLIGGVGCGVDGWERTHTAPDIARWTDGMVLLGC